MSEDDEMCPQRVYGHCPHWEDGWHCCGCGDPISTDGTWIYQPCDQDDQAEEDAGARYRPGVIL